MGRWVREGEILGEEMERRGGSGKDIVEGVGRKERVGVFLIF